MTCPHNVITDGQFHVYPVGAKIWQCTICQGNFAWNDQRSAYGTIEYTYAVFCSPACAAKFDPTKCKNNHVMPIGVVGADRVPRSL